MTIGERIEKTPIEVKTNQNPMGRKGWKRITIRIIIRRGISRKRVELDKNLLQLLMMFPKVTMNTLIVDT